MKKLLNAALLAASLLLSQASQAAIAIGEKAPEFSLPAADGSMQSLSSYAGKIIVLEWYNPECPFVRKHYDSNNMQSLQKEYAGKDVVWLTVSSSAEGKQGYLSAGDAAALLKKDGAPAPTHLLLDHGGTVGKLYDAKTTPHMFVVDRKGKLAYAGAIDDKPSADKADIASAKNYVREAVEALLAGKPVETAATKSYGCGVKYKE